MIANIIEAVQQNLNFAPLTKIDPNDQKPKEKPLTSAEKLSQAAIPAVLAGLYKFTRTDEGSATVFSGRGDGSWLSTFFGDKRFEAVDKVAQYAGIDKAEAESAMEKVAAEAVTVSRTAVSDGKDAAALKSFISGQRHHILTFLPAKMQFGDLMGDDTLDDRTNKMEGPISNLVHKIENKLSGGGS